MKTVITRHPALVQHLIEIGLISPDSAVIAHATAEDVRDKHVIGVLPLSLAAEAASVTEIPMNLPAELRGKELTIEQVRRFAGKPVRYCVSIADPFTQGRCPECGEPGTHCTCFHSMPTPRQFTTGCVSKTGGQWQVLEWEDGE